MPKFNKMNDNDQGSLLQEFIPDSINIGLLS